jgi:hypothetical protein
MISGQMQTLTVVGGAAGMPFTLLTTTEVDLPPAQWTPVLSREFDTFGVSTFTDFYEPTEPQRYFLLQRP